MSSLVVGDMSSTNFARTNFDTILKSGFKHNPIYKISFLIWYQSTIILRDLLCH